MLQDTSSVGERKNSRRHFRICIEKSAITGWMSFIQSEIETRNYRISNSNKLDGMVASCQHNSFMKNVLTSFHGDA